MSGVVPGSREFRPEDRVPKDRFSWPDSCFSSMLDGERHSLKLGIDFGPASGQVEEWIPRQVQPDLIPGESPVMNWLNVDPHNHNRGRHYVVQEGWSMAAVRLKCLADVLDLDVDVKQVNRRSPSGELLRTEYIFQMKDDEE